MENSVSENGEYINKKPSMLYWEWYRKPDSNIAGAVCIDHVHLSVEILPKLSISNFMGYIKGKSTLMIYDRHPELKCDRVCADGTAC